MLEFKKYDSPLAKIEYMTYTIIEVMKKNAYERFAQYQEQWIALTSDEEELIAHAPDLSLVVRTAQQKGVKRPVYLHIPRWDANFAPACSR
ncbi:MAG: hypothetical protein HY399_06630 [Elusimicrobia bacterium]|nr:hypothetical protein [Elusimicrobiota bacterium]